MKTKTIMGNDPWKPLKSQVFNLKETRLELFILNILILILY